MKHNWNQSNEEEKHTNRTQAMYKDKLYSIAIFLLILHNFYVPGVVFMSKVSPIMKLCN